MAEGVVYKVFERPGKFGTMYSIKLNDDANYYGTGKARPPVKEGQKIQFSAAQNARGYWDADVNSIKVVEATVSAAPSARSVAGKDDYWNRKEERDLVENARRHEGASRNTAIEFVKFLVEQEALPVPAKKAEKADALLEYVEHYKAIFMGEVGKEESNASATEAAPVETAEGGDWN